MLRDYEILYIVRPELDDTAVNEAVQTVETLIKNLGGEPSKSDVWGRRRLAYEVAHLREGYYVLTDFALPAERVAELEATLKISDTVFRHLVTRKPEKAKRQGERSAGARGDGERAPREQAQRAAAAATAEAPAAAVAPEPEEEAEA